MVEILSETDQITGLITKIIKNSENELIIVSPYIQVSNWVKIKDALEYIVNNQHSVKITFITRKREEEERSKKIMQELAGFLDKCQVYFMDNLHSKIYMNEKEALVSSMNFYEHSAETNHEIGVHFQKEDIDHRKELMNHIHYLQTESSVYQPLGKQKKQETELSNPKTENVQESFMVLSKGYKWLKVITAQGYENKIAIQSATGLKEGKIYTATVFRKWKRTSYGFDVELTNIAGLGEKKGHCIICKTELPLDREKPLCYGCYMKNKQYRGNIFGKLCHMCGNPKSEITDAKPLCLTCYDIYENFAKYLLV